jgi:hypothetical protein
VQAHIKRSDSCVRNEERGIEMRIQPVAIRRAEKAQKAAQERHNSSASSAVAAEQWQQHKG